jgi:hypothetical protein
MDKEKFGRGRRRTKEEKEVDYLTLAKQGHRVAITSDAFAYVHMMTDLPL